MSLPPSYSYSEFNQLVHPVDSLPSYTTGAEVRPISDTSLNELLPPPLQIVLSQECYSRESFDIGDIIHGHLVLTPRTPLHLAQLIIAFGYDEAVKQHKWVSDTVTCKYGQLGEFVVPRSSFSSGADETGVIILEPGFEYSFPFAVQVPELQATSNCKHDEEDSARLQHLRLPPSLGSPPERNIPINNIENNDARISYKLVAMARVRDQSAPGFQANEYIHLLPSYAIVLENAEHSSIKDFQLRPRGVLRRTAFRGAVKMKIEGAKTIVMCGAPTVATLTLVATPAAPGLPSPAIADIFVKLTAYTSYLSETPKCNTFGIAMPAMDFTPWTSLFSQAAGNTNTDKKLVIPLKLKLPQTKLITPTFASCIIERWYTLTVSVVLSDYSIMALEMPVVIVANAHARSAAPYTVGAPTPVHLRGGSEIGNYSRSGRLDSINDNNDWDIDPLRDISRRPVTSQQHRSDGSRNNYNDGSLINRGSVDSSGLRCSSNNSNIRYSTTGDRASASAAVNFSDPPSYICI